MSNMELKASYALHSYQGVAHRDLKPENIMFESDDIGSTISPVQRSFSHVVLFGMFPHTIDQSHL